MSLRVFHALPDEGSVSLGDLSKKTGAEEALLGTHFVAYAVQDLSSHNSSSTAIGSCLSVRATAP